jgi:hypothetical protein
MALGQQQDQPRPSGIFRPIRPAIGSPRQFHKLGIRQRNRVSHGRHYSNVLQRVDKEKSRVVTIDRLTGYQNAVPSERFLLVQMHELLASLIYHPARNRGAAETASFELTYLSDLVISSRYFEAAGRVWLRRLDIRANS